MGLKVFKKKQKMGMKTINKTARSKHTKHQSSNSTPRHHLANRQLSIGKQAA